MASPIGHGLVGMALARRFGVRSKPGLLATAMAASLPDADIIASLLIHRDPWKLHRGGTHTFNFALAAGAAAGLAGIIGAESIEGERDLIFDAIMGATIVGSHIALDRVPIPGITGGPTVAGMSLANWVIDVVVWGALAWALWPRGAAPDRAAETA